MNVFSQLRHPLHLYHKYVFSLSSSSATCLHSASFCCVPSPQAPSKSNPEPCADGLWYSSHRSSAAANGCSVWRSAPHSCFCQQFNSKGKLTKWFLSNYLFGSVIISNAGGIPTDTNDICPCEVASICKINKQINKWTFYETPPVTNKLILQNSWIANEYFARAPLNPPLSHSIEQTDIWWPLSCNYCNNIMAVVSHGHASRIPIMFGSYLIWCLSFMGWKRAHSSITQFLTTISPCQLFQKADRDNLSREYHPPPHPKIELTASKIKTSLTKVLPLEIDVNVQSFF